MFNYPCLLLLGLDDSLAPYYYAKKWVKNMIIKDITIQEYNEGKHEMILDVE